MYGWILIKPSRPTQQTGGRLGSSRDNASAGDRDGNAVVNTSMQGIEMVTPVVYSLHVVLDRRYEWTARVRPSQQTTPCQTVLRLAVCQRIEVPAKKTADCHVPGRSACNPNTPQSMKRVKRISETILEASSELQVMQKQSSGRAARSREMFWRGRAVKVYTASCASARACAVGEDASGPSVSCEP